jgi:murein L,D-transpeptidase YcbB/YkuD
LERLLNCIHPWITHGNHALLACTPIAILPSQAFLYARGYKISIDRKFGKETDDALKKYQISQGLDDDGIVGQKTWRVMFGQK